ncbi:MAG: tryptophan 2,3-dioxygenase [Woeseiaceae bacterium]|jgi:tryptophan 2,3-dioxygenase|nr:tryptophan 2,3-dioxygenase family protein [Woeseiaceae bacterium]|tara:strand:+ start:668 stop:1603 length:936 start_codon:yes stop_codon:yes gene_type:complete
MIFDFEIPDIIDIEKVDGSPKPRKMTIGSEASRQETVKMTEGQPITEFEGNTNPYIDYESIDLLLSLQHPRSQGYDEMCFIVMGQSKELLFKSIYYELYNARLRVIADDLPNASLMIARSKEIMLLLTKFWDVLATIRPEGFKSFRDYLNVASGQQSFMFRHVEFILGNKNKAMAAVHKNVSHVYPAIMKNLETPSFYDEVIKLLQRRGFDISSECLDRDWTKLYQSHESIEQAWLKIYKNPQSTNDLYLFGELLTEFADIFSRYRFQHFTTVERILGFKPGTGGSAGVNWLKTMAAHRFFPELWSMRTQL